MAKIDRLMNKAALNMVSPYEDYDYSRLTIEELYELIDENITDERVREITEPVKFMNTYPNSVRKRLERLTDDELYEMSEKYSRVIGGDKVDKVDRMIDKAAPKNTLSEKLYVDNPYLGKSYKELMQMQSENNYTAPHKGTIEWSQYMVAVLRAFSDRRKRNDMFDRAGGVVDEVPAPGPVELPAYYREIPKEIPDAPVLPVDPMAAFNRLYGGGG